MPAMQARTKLKRLRCKMRTVQMLTRRGFLRTESATMRLPGATPSQSAPQERATLATARGCCPSAALRSDATWPLGVSDVDLLPGGDPLGP